MNPPCANPRFGPTWGGVDELSAPEHRVHVADDVPAAEALELHQHCGAHHDDAELGEQLMRRGKGPAGREHIVHEQHPRAGGKVVMQRVTPRHGRPYLLMDHKADGSFTKMDNSIDGHLSVPQWVLMEF